MPAKPVKGRFSHNNVIPDGVSRSGILIRKGRFRV
jgi:hypothetical protein